MDAGNHTSLNGAWDGLTIAAWIKFEDVTSLSAIVSKWAGNEANDHFMLSISNEGKIGIIVNHGQTPTGSGVSTRGDTQLAPNEWHFVAGTWEAGTGTYNLYVNGELDGTGTQFTPGGVPKVINTNSNTPLRIGAQAGTGSFGRYFDGWIDEVAVFNTALTGEELMGLYRTATIPEPSTALLAAMGLLWLLARRRRN